MDVGVGVAGLTFRNAWAPEDQGAAHALFVDVLFAEESVAAHGEAVVGGVDDEGVLCVRGGVEGVDDASYLFIEMGYEAVVFAELVAYGFFRSGPRDVPVSVPE